MKDAFDLREAEKKAQGASRGFFSPLFRGIGDVATGAGQAIEFGRQKLGIDSFGSTADKLKGFGAATQETFTDFQ